MSDPFWVFAYGSLMWAPLAAVIAFGLLFSMFFTLLVVPALYVLTARDQPTAVERPQ